MMAQLGGPADSSSVPVSSIPATRAAAVVKATIFFD
jgi:hypothetical protein